MHPTILSVSKSVVDGKALLPEQAAGLLPLAAEHRSDLFALARISASAAGAQPFLCGIINAKSGRCAENCAFCAQSAHHDTGSPVYPLVERDVLIRRAEELAAAGAAYMGIVISGTGPGERDFARLLEDARAIRERVDINICGSLGLLGAEQAAALKQAGFSSYHHNLECAPSHYGKICTTHDIAPRLETVRRAKAAGLRVCSGGIFGLGESPAQRVELSAVLLELGVDSIPVNFLTPVQGTPLEKAALLPPQDALTAVALLRLMHPARDIVLCGGRSAVLGQWENMFFAAGANGLMIGDYLTTKGSTFQKDRDMLAALGILPRKP